jgi:CPA2 family monovalent cation:H+ antiporter-2
MRSQASVAQAAHCINPGIDVVIRTHSPDAVEIFRREAIGAVFFDEEELARGMKNHILSRFAPQQTEGHTPAHGH